MYDLHANMHYIRDYIRDVSDDCMSLQYFIEALQGDINETISLVERLESKIRKHIARLQNILDHSGGTKVRIHAKKNRIEDAIKQLKNDLAALDRTPVDEEDSETKKEKEDLRIDIQGQLNIEYGRMENIEELLDAVENLEDTTQDSIHQLDMFLQSLKSIYERLHALKSNTEDIMKQFTLQVEDAIRNLQKCFDAIEHYKNANSAHKDFHAFYDRQSIFGQSRETQFFKTSRHALRDAENALEKARKRFNESSDNLEALIDENWKKVDDKTKKDLKALLDHKKFLKEALNKGVKHNQRSLKVRIENINNYSLT